MRKKPMTKREKEFIRSRVEKQTAARRIAREMDRSHATVINFINRESLRTDTEKKEIIRRSNEETKRRLRKRKFPVHKKRSQIVASLKKTKKQKNRTLKDIAGKWGVSPGYVARVNSEEKILSSEEIKTIAAKFRKGKPFSAESKRLYREARKMLEETDLNFSAIANNLGTYPLFVQNANKGRGEDKLIRDRERRLEIVYGLSRKRVNHFSAKEKLALIEEITPFVIGKLRFRNVEEKSWAEVIDYVKERLFTKLDYFSLERDIPVEVLMRTFSKYYIANALGNIAKESKIKSRAGEIRHQRGIAPAEEKTSINGIISREIIGRMKEVIGEREIFILQKSAQGMSNRKIGEKLDLSHQRVRVLKGRAMKKLRERFGEEAR